MEIKPAAREALLRLLEPLTGFAMDSGLSIQELSALMRQAAVHSVAAQQLEVSNRVNISGIAAATGISRADVSKILRIREGKEVAALDRHQQSTNKILAVWNQDPKYTAPNGQPADLKIYGRGGSFDSLAKTHGRGIPTRALLDELLRTGAVELRSAQVLRLKTSLPIDKGLTPTVIKAFGDRVTELMTTLLQNIRRPEHAMFVASVSGSNLRRNEMPLLRKEITKKSSELLTELRDVLVQLPNQSVQKKSFRHDHKVSLTIYYHESARNPNQRNLLPTRRNFRRAT